MGAEQIVGVLLLAAGALSMLFRRAVGTAWSRVGQFFWSRSKIPGRDKMTPEDMLKPYDETEAPNIGLFIGLLLVLTGAFCIFLPLIVR
ncbi:MAG: hypothetical protein AB1921_00435 [Thermodesulfobacteriota bacterium]